MFMQALEILSREWVSLEDQRRRFLRVLLIMMEVAIDEIVGLLVENELLMCDHYVYLYTIDVHQF